MVKTVKPLIYCYHCHSTSHRFQTSTIEPWTQTRALITSPTPAFLSGASGFPYIPPTLSASSSPCSPAGLPPSPHQLQPTPCSASHSLCDPGGYRVREVRGPSPHCYPRHLSEVCSSVSEAPRPCRPTPTRPSGSHGETRIPPVLVNNDPVQSVWSSSIIERITFMCNFAFDNVLAPPLYAHLCTWQKRK